MENTKRLVTVVCDDYKSEKELPPDDKLEVTGFDALSYLEGAPIGGLLSTRTIWWIGYASNKEEALTNCKENWKKNRGNS